MPTFFLLQCELDDTYGILNQRRWDGILSEHFNLEVVLRYQSQFPQLRTRFELFDLLRPTVTKLTLNRNRDYGYKDDGDRPHASEYGKVRNALHEISILVK